MNKKQIEEIRKDFKISDKLMFDFVEELNLWIIGGLGPVDIQPNGVKLEQASTNDFSKIRDSFQKYITECDAKEGFCMYKFKTPFLTGREIREAEMLFIQCTNNGTSYFACSNLAVLQSFVFNANEEIMG